jgi:hypothetical protein
MTAKRSKASLQTHHALQASDLAAAMNDALRKVRIAPGEYAPELTAPQGPSTAGGVQAMQHLRLVPGQTGQPVLVVGHANHAEGKAELRTYDHVDAIHRQRFHRPLELDRTAYEDFLAFAKQMFTALHLHTTVVGPPDDLVTDTPPVAGGSLGRSKMIAIVFATGAMVALIIAALAMLLRG